MTRLGYPILSAALFLVSLFLPGAEDQGPPQRGFYFQLLGGYFLIAAPVLPANAFYLAGWAGFIRKSRRWTVLCGIAAVVVAIAGLFPWSAWVFVVGYPAYWCWLASFAVLMWAGFQMPKPNLPATAPPEHA